VVNIIIKIKQNLNLIPPQMLAIPSIQQEKGNNCELNVTEQNAKDESEFFHKHLIKDDERKSKSNEKLVNFDAMNLKEELLRGIYSFSFEKPSDFQQRAIISILRGNDVIAQGKSGTGKTAASLISILQQLDMSITDCQAIILAPTRELAQDMQVVLSHLGEFVGATSLACVGGKNFEENLSRIKQGIQIILGTPSSVSLMIERNLLNTRFIKIVLIK
jgi:translation initiation factor 4A